MRKIRSDINFMITFSLILCFIITTLLTHAPLSLLILVLLSTTTLSIIIALLLSTWTRLLTFLVFVGGLIVIFTYFICANPNHQIKIAYMWGPFFAAYLLANNFGLFPPQNNLKLKIALTTPIINLHSLPLILLLITILLIILIIVVSITTIEKRPIRPFKI